MGKEQRDYSNLGTMSAKALRSIADELVRFDAVQLQSSRRLFDFRELRDPKSVESKIKQQLKQKHPFIYLIFANEAACISKIVSTFKVSKETDKDRKYSRINEEEDAGNSRCLYVGSSNPGFARFKQHFGLKAKKTYSLQLLAWASELSGGIEIDTIEFLDEKNSRLLPFIEDALADIYKPAFGRRGSA